MHNLPLGLDIYDYPVKPHKYAEFFRLSCGFKNKVAVVSLICLLTSKYKDKDPNTTCKDVIKKLLKDNMPSNEMLEELSEICEGFMSPGSNDYINYNLKSAKEMQTEIIKIMNCELPF